MTSNDATINLQKIVFLFFCFFKHGAEFGKRLGMISIGYFSFSFYELFLGDLVVIRN